MFEQIFIPSAAQGLLYGLTALAVLVSFRVLRFPDLTVDGSFVLGAAVFSRLVHCDISPVLAMGLVIIAGGLAGLITAFLNTKLHLSPLMAGIATMIALYTVNLRIMGRANLPLLDNVTCLSFVEKSSGPLALLLFLLCIIIVIKVVLDLFFATQLGLALRASGDNVQMLRACGGNPASMTFVGLAISNGLASASGALVAQFQGFADVGMGTGIIIVALGCVLIGEILIPPIGRRRLTIGPIVGSCIFWLTISLALRLGLPPTDLKLVTAILVVVILYSFSLRKSKEEIKLLLGKGI